MDNIFEKGFNKINTIMDLNLTKFENKTVTWDGNKHTITATEIPEGVTVVYTPSNEFTAVGIHEVTATFTETETEETETKIATLTINKKDASNLDEVIFESKSVVFDGKEQQIIATNLPDGVTVSYAPSNKLTAVGSVEITATFNEDLGEGVEEIGTKKATLTITKKDASNLDTVKFASKSVVFNDKEQELIATDLPVGVTVTYAPNSKFKVVGVHNIKATFKEDLGTGTPEEIGTKDATLTITKKQASDLSGVKFASKSVEHTGTEQSIIATELPVGVTVSYNPSNKLTAVGSVEITATFKEDLGTGTPENIGTKKATLTITEAIPSLDEVIFEYKTVKYNGLDQEIVATNLPKDVTVTYEPSNKFKLVGTHKVTAKFHFKEQEIGTKVADLIIQKKDAPSLDAVKFDNKSVKFDGKEQSIVATVLPADVTVSYAPENKLTAVGSVEITATFKADLGTGTPEEIGTKVATLTITKKDAPSLDTVKFANKSVTWNEKEHEIIATDLPDGVTVSYAPANKFVTVGEHTITATFKADLGTGTPEEIGTKDATLTINKKIKSSLDEVVFDGYSVVFDGESHSIKATNLPTGVTVTYEPSDEFIEVGTHEITATFNENLGEGEEVIGTKKATLIISEKELPSLDDVIFKCETVVYDGEPHTIDATNLPENVSVTYEPEDKEFIEVGEHKITANFYFEDELIGSKEVTLTIKEKVIIDTDLEEAISIIKSEDYFNWISIGSILKVEEITAEIFVEFMEAYILLELLFEARQYRLVEIYFNMTGLDLNILRK